MTTPDKLVETGLVRYAPVCDKCDCGELHRDEEGGWYWASDVDAILAAKDEWIAELQRFIRSYADHDDDCPAYVVGAGGCNCGFSARLMALEGR